MVTVRMDDVFVTDSSKRHVYTFDPGTDDVIDHT
jgi:hypothetical protein